MKGLWTRLVLMLGGTGVPEPAWKEAVPAPVVDLQEAVMEQTGEPSPTEPSPAEPSPAAECLSLADPLPGWSVERLYALITAQGTAEVSGAAADKAQVHPPALHPPVLVAAEEPVWDVSDLAWPDADTLEWLLSVPEDHAAPEEVEEALTDPTDHSRVPEAEVLSPSQQISDRVEALLAANRERAAQPGLPEWEGVAQPKPQELEFAALRRAGLSRLRAGLVQHDQ